MSQPFLGEIRMFGFGFAPRGWALCNGQTMSIAQNTALFALLGTTYGGNGTTTYLLPNLQSRVPIHQGQGAGLSPYVLGQVSGTESVTLSAGQMPAHNHTFQPPCNNGVSNDSIPTNAFPADGGLYNTAANSAMGAGTTGPAGSSQPFGILPPYLTISFCMALEGIFPSRN